MPANSTLYFVNLGADAHTGNPDNWFTDFGVTPAGRVPGVGDTLVFAGMADDSISAGSVTWLGTLIDGTGSVGCPGGDGSDPTGNEGNVGVTIESAGSNLALSASGYYSMILIQGTSSASRITFHGDFTGYYGDGGDILENVIVTGDFSAGEIFTFNVWSNIEVLGNITSNGVMEINGLHVHGTTDIDVVDDGYNQPYVGAISGTFDGLVTVVENAVIASAHNYGSLPSGTLNRGMAIEGQVALSGGKFYDTTAMNLPAANKVLTPASGGPVGFGPGKTAGTYTPPAGGGGINGSPILGLVGM